MMRFIVWVILGLFLSPMVYGQDIVWDSLKSGVGIRALSMGGAYTAIADGFEAPFYNPAGVVSVGVGASYENLDVKNRVYDPFDVYSVSYCPFRYSYLQMARSTGDFSYVSVFSFSRRGQNGVQWGINYKQVRAQVNSTIVNGFSSDLGVLMPLGRNVMAGVMLQDIFNEDVSVSTTVRAGLSFNNVARSFIFSSDLVYQDGQDLEPHVGVEYTVTDGFIVRGGFFKGNLSGGVRFQFGVFALDTAIVRDPVDSREMLYMFGVHLGKS